MLLCLRCGRWRITQTLGPRAREILPSFRTLTNEAERTLDLPKRRSRHGTGLEKRGTPSRFDRRPPRVNMLRDRSPLPRQTPTRQSCTPPARDSHLHHSQRSLNSSISRFSKLSTSDQRGCLSLGFFFLFFFFFKKRISVALFKLWVVYDYSNFGTPCPRDRFHHLRRSQD